MWKAPFIRYLPRNRRGRDLVIGDIHGHFSRVEQALARVGFEPARDRLICVGDLIDRGPESVLAADWLEQPWFFAVLGNHDASLLQRGGLLSAKFELWHDYHDWLHELDRPAQQRLQESLAALPWALEIESAAGPVGVVHAEVPEAFASWQDFVAQLDEERVRSLAVSSRDLARRAEDLGTPGAADESRLAGVAWVIHGHTPRRYCRPGQLGNRLWIDTMGWYDGQLQGEPRFTIVDIDDPLTPL
jgi:serine/threonine protein phosphatase 1